MVVCGLVTLSYKKLPARHKNTGRRVTLGLPLVPVRKVALKGAPCRAYEMCTDSLKEGSLGVGVRNPPTRVGRRISGTLRLERVVAATRNAREVRALGSDLGNARVEFQNWLNARQRRGLRRAQSIRHVPKPPPPPPAPVRSPPARDERPAPNPSPLHVFLPPVPVPGSREAAMAEMLARHEAKMAAWKQQLASNPPVSSASYTPRNDPQATRDRDAADDARYHARLERERVAAEAKKRAEEDARILAAVRASRVASGQTELDRIRARLAAKVEETKRGKGGEGKE
jgi:hypothetical protein